MSSASEAALTERHQALKRMVFGLISKRAASLARACSKRASCRPQGIRRESRRPDSKAASETVEGVDDDASEKGQPLAVAVERDEAWKEGEGEASKERKEDN